MEISKDQTLKPNTTFKIGGPARYFAGFETPDELRELLAFRKTHNLNFFVLAGGSNILVSDCGFDGLVIHPVNKGITAVEEDAKEIALRIQAAEAWDDVVGFAVEHEWWGIENLAHIPGQAGAALVQNIGAYGAQLSDVFKSVEVMEVATGKVRTLDREACRLGYRSSIFNSSDKGRFIISSFRIRLAKHRQPNLRYPDVRAYFEQRGHTSPSLGEIRQAITSIRDTKFPFPREEKGGNAGSFFKNLLLSEAEYLRLEDHFQRNFTDDLAAKLRILRSKFHSAGRIKIPTAFLIDACGLRGHRIGGAQVNPTQPLVLLNQDGATARDVLSLARHIRRTVHEKTGVAIALEPELVGFTPVELAEYGSLE
jgi:UDP-N-acetylmuramate dehydrogenase